MKILVADDDPICRTLISVSVKSIDGMDVTVAEDGDQAWALMNGRTFDLVILDWQMPGKTGLEIAARARSMGSRVPILMVTAEAEKERVMEAIQAGVSDYLIKPFDTTLLWEKLNKFRRPSDQRRKAEAAARSPT
jgi:two-component system chemotaxis response regulator CheY